MTTIQSIVRERRQYNKYAASQTLEDYALRFTAHKARRWSAFVVANTALGSTAFLACEAIGGMITLNYGASNAIVAILIVTVLMFAIGLPIAYHSARSGLDIDLLTRGAGFGYIGSTITSLIYASFTFLLFAIEASIMSLALEMMLGIPLWMAHIVSSLVVIPIVYYGMRMISRMQLATQPIWLVLQLIPILYILFFGRGELDAWRGFSGTESGGNSVDMLYLGLAVSALLSLLPQIGEQADYLRFMPDRERTGRVSWWAAVLLAGPGWIFIGGVKILAGSVLAVVALDSGVPFGEAANPTSMFFVAFRDIVNDPVTAVVLTGIFVITCQMKINVTNAYAGSIAWSNFFSRLTHTHPGRGVWLVFNVLLALLLLEFGILRVITGILVLYASFATGWIGALSADLMINKPLGLSPAHIEFKRAHLYDVNPVGVGAMLLSIFASVLAIFGFLGPMPEAWAPILGLAVAFLAAPLIAFATRGRYYIARRDTLLPAGDTLQCVICENTFERPDMAHCPVYAAPICSLCCSLESHCYDDCKTNSRFPDQMSGLLQRLLPRRVTQSVPTGVTQFLGVFGLFLLVIGFILALIYLQYGNMAPLQREVIGTTLKVVFLSFFTVSGIAAWLLVLAQKSRRLAEEEASRRMALLMNEVEAHKKTDAALQKAKEQAEAANAAKSRYIAGISHEIRSPLNAIFGYAQLLERDDGPPPRDAVRIIRQSSEHLANLVDGLMDISKVENGQLQLHRDRVNLPDFLEQIVGMFRLQAASKGVEFIYEPPERLPDYVYVDQKRFRQILINLLSNAIKYTPSGHARLKFTYRRLMGEFEISDSGVGIAPEDMERIFEPFERGTGKSSTIARGTGLGLTITKVLTHLLGGEIRVDSTPNVGSTFTVRLMLPSTTSEDDIPQAAKQICGYAGERRTILAIDDDQQQLTLLERVLQPLGFSVYTAEEGTSGLQLAAACRPDLVLLDIAMPGLNGWEVARRLRARHGPELKIIMLSGNSSEYAPSYDGETLHNAFVTKPTDIPFLLERIGTALTLNWLNVPQMPPREKELETVGAPASDGPSGGQAAVSVPAEAHPHVAELYRLGQVGHVMAIHAKLDAMDAEHAANKPLVEALRRHLVDFNFDAYLNLLDAAKEP